jgi:hypothetical protein
VSYSISEVAYFLQTILIISYLLVLEVKCLLKYFAQVIYFGSYTSDLFTQLYYLRIVKALRRVFVGVYFLGEV